MSDRFKPIPGLPMPPRDVLDQIARTFPDSEPLDTREGWIPVVEAKNRAQRRCDMLRWTPAETAIHEAIQAVERAGADVRLTDAVILLSHAQCKVADFVDGVNT